MLANGETKPWITTWVHSSRILKTAAESHSIGMVNGDLDTVFAACVGLPEGATPIGFPKDDPGYYSRPGKFNTSPFPSSFQGRWDMSSHKQCH